MFTGLVQAVGTVAEAAPTPGGILRLTVEAPRWTYRPAPGDSIAVNGCCLTQAGPPRGPTTLTFEAVPQTLSLTTLGGLKAGDRVNLEHAATPSTLLGGHLVQGHVDGVGAVESVRASAGGDYRVTVRVPAGVEPFMVPKGSVCIDGVSLTIAEVAQGGGLVTVALIPTTLEMTTLGELVAGRGVNIEADATTKAVVTTVLRYMESRR